MTPVCRVHVLAVIALCALLFLWYFKTALNPAQLHYILGMSGTLPLVKPALLAE